MKKTIYREVIRVGMKRFAGTMAAVSLGLSVLAGGPVPALAQASSAPPLTMVPDDAGLFQENFNPLTSTSLGGTVGLVYEPLFYFSRVNNKTYSLLGTKYGWSNHGKTLTVTIRSGVKWSDGQPLTVNDVLFSYNLLKTWPAADAMGVWQRVKSVEAKGSNEVVFNFKNVDSPFVYTILQSVTIIPEHIWSKITTDPTKETNPNPVGSGPFVLDKFSPQAYYFKVNPHYWGGKPAVPEVEFPAYTGSDSWDLGLVSGQIHWGGGFITNIDNVWVSKDPAHRHYWFPPDSPVVLYVNTKNPLLGQLAVRKAISLAIDRKPLAQVAEYGYEQVASPTGLVLPNQKAWLDPKLPKSDLTFTHDPAQAEQLLQSAGFKKNGSGIYTSPSGQPLTFNLNVVAGWTDWDEQAMMIAQDLQQIGIQANVKQLQFGDYASQMKGNYDMSIGGTLGGVTPFDFFNGFLNPQSRLNHEHWNLGRSTGDLRLWENSTDQKTQLQAAYELERIVAEQLPAIPLTYGATWYEYDTTHYTGWPTQSNPYADPAPYDFPAAEIVLMHLKPVK